MSDAWFEAAMPGFSGAWRKLPPNARGALWMMLGAVFFSVMAVLIKSLGGRLGSPVITHFRALFGLAVVMPFALRYGIGGVKTGRLPLHILRGAIGSCAMMLGFYSLTKLPLADAVALSFTRPFFLIILAVVFLGEVVRLRRWSATAVGFVGVVVMVRPTGEIEFATFAAILGAFLVAAAVVCVKKLSTTERPSVLLFYFGIVSCLTTLGPAVYYWRTPTPLEFIALIAVGATAATGQACVVRGLAVGDATAVAPFDYTRLLFAAAFGFLVFGEVPDAWMWAGAAIVVAASVYIAQREIRLGRRETATAPPREGN